MRCPNCGAHYRAINEIQKAGGRVYQLGLALKAVCGCDHKLGSVQGLFLVRERIENVRPIRS